MMKKTLRVTSVLLILALSLSLLAACEFDQTFYYNGNALSNRTIKLNGEYESGTLSLKNTQLYLGLVIVTVTADDIPYTRVDNVYTFVYKDRTFKLYEELSLRGVSLVSKNGIGGKRSYSLIL